jgi:putative ABC transport system substrate-binding protein
MSGIGRREFVSLLGSAAAWPLVASAQQQAMPVIGFLSAVTPAQTTPMASAFVRSLSETGFVEGHNVAIEYRWAEGHLDRLPALVSDLVRHRAALIVVGSNAGAFSAKQATTTIPIVFVMGADPVELGLVASLNRPGGNMTGVYQFTTGLEAKRLGLLHELFPKATTIAVLVNPNYAGAENQLRDVHEAAGRLGVQLVVLRANTETEFTSAFADFSQQRADSLLVSGSPFFNSRREQLVALAARHVVPAIYERRDFSAAGGLMSYGTSLADAYRHAGAYAGRILKGENPADLPVMQSTKFEFVINLKTAKALGLTVPDNLLVAADEVIE